MTIIQHRDCGDEQEKKERAFEAWAVIDCRGRLASASEEEDLVRSIWDVNGNRIVPCRVIVEAP